MEKRFMNAVTIVSFVAMLCSFLGNGLINYKKKIGYVVWIVSNLLWVIVNLMGEPNACQIMMFVGYAGFNIHGWMKWTKEEREASSKQ